MISTATCSTARLASSAAVHGRARGGTASRIRNANSHSTRESGKRAIESSAGVAKVTDSNTRPMIAPSCPARARIVGLVAPSFHPVTGSPITAAIASWTAYASARERARSSSGKASIGRAASHASARRRPAS